MSSEIILYDIPSKGANPRCWSYNPWKARASLNYKGLPYKTEWVEYPDIKPTFVGWQIPKNDPSTAPMDYTCPAAKLPDGSLVMDSRKIVEAVEKLHPQPSLHMSNGPVIDRAQAVVLELHLALGAITIPRVPERLLSPRSAEYFHETRAKRFGMPLGEMAKSDNAGETAWTNADPHLQEMKAMLNEKPGPYVLGEEVSFADMIIASFWVFAKELDENGDLFDRGMKYDKSFPRHYEACQKCFERVD